MMEVNMAYCDTAGAAAAHGFEFSVSLLCADKVLTANRTEYYVLNLGWLYQKDRKD
jgi:hypothetical protein